MAWLNELTQAAHCQLDERVLDALAARGVSEDQAKSYSIGYLNQHLPEIDYPTSFLSWSGAGERLKDVYVIPLTNTLGEVRGVQFRPVERGGGGYSDFIEGVDEAVLFGLAQAMPTIWATRSVYLVEGAFDLFPIQRIFPGVVATLTAKVTLSLVRVLRRLVQHVWLGYDADKAGLAAAEQFALNHGKEFSVKVIQYPKVPMIGTTKLTKDPGDLWELWGDARLQDYLRPLLQLPCEEPTHAQVLR